MGTCEIEYTLGFDDDTQQKVTIGPFAEDGFGRNAKQRIIEFNNNFGSDTAKLMLSKYGGKWTGIDRARIITTYITTYF